MAAAASLIEERLTQGPADARRPVVIVCGDSPMLRPESVTGLLRRFHELQADCLLGSAITTDPTGLGRIVRDAEGRVRSIVEQKDATLEQLAIREGNTGVMAIPARPLRAWLSGLRNANAQKEYYLTDVIAMAVADQVAVAPLVSPTVAEVLGISVQTAGPLRSGLIRKGMIWSPAHGQTAFTVPMFDAFMVRAMPEWGQEPLAER